MYRARYLVVCGCLQLLLCLVLQPGTSLCLKLDSKHQQLQLDRSGWQTIEVGATIDDYTGQSNSQALPREEDETSPSSPSSPPPQSHTTKYNRKLIEWDDDENNNNNSLGSSAGLILPYEDNIEPNKKRSSGDVDERRLNKKWPRKAGKLIFHGTLKNSTTKTVEGLKFHINTHRPVPISRQQLVAIGASNSPHRIVGRNLLSMSRQHDYDGPETIQEELERTTTTTTTTTTTKRPSSLKRNKQFSTSINGVGDFAKLASTSDWRPLVVAPNVAARQRRIVKNTSGGDEKMATTGQTQFDSKWRPIAGPTNKRDGLLAATSSQRQHKSTIEEPFDDENVMDNTTPPPSSSSSPRESKSIGQKLILREVDNRWTPVDTTTTTTTTGTSPAFSDTTELPSPLLATVVPPLATKSSSSKGNSSSDSIHQLRSASDLNYIYSSQPSGSAAAPAIGSDWQRAMQPASYYSAYQQPTAVEQPTFPAGAVVDTTSGQVPEMVMDGRLEPPPPLAQDYSAPLTSGSFQPAQPPPIRAPPQLGAYGAAAAAAYDTSSYYSTPPLQQPQPQPQPQPTRLLPPATPPPNQYVRQEHHYHYYNGNNGNNQQQQPQRLQPQTQLVRELQPVLISQPIIQQQPSPTPSPQIIREIIKEVPMQTVQLPPVQVPRIMVPQAQPQRELDQGAYYQPAQRIIRQISGSIPSMSVRQIRLPLPTIQLPVRLAAPTNPAPVTRQTGSYLIPPLPHKTTTYLTETQAMPTHTTIMHTTQYTPATRTTVYTTDHQPPPPALVAAAAVAREAQPQAQPLGVASGGYKR